MAEVDQKPAGEGQNTVEVIDKTSPGKSALDNDVLELESKMLHGCKSEAGGSAGNVKAGELSFVPHPST